MLKYSLTNNYKGKIYAYFSPYGTFQPAKFTSSHPGVRNASGAVIIQIWAKMHMNADFRPEFSSFSALVASEPIERPTKRDYCLLKNNLI